MLWFKRILGIVLALLGLLWVGQGLGMIPGSFMTGQFMWAAIGAVLLLVAAWLLWSAARTDVSA
jgi:hypothetical protein